MPLMLVATGILNRTDQQHQRKQCSDPHLQPFQLTSIRIRNFQSPPDQARDKYTLLEIDLTIPPIKYITNTRFPQKPNLKRKG